MLTALFPCPPSPNHSYIGFDVYRTFFIGSIFSLSTALAFSVGRWGERAPSLKRTVFLNRLFLRLVRLEPDDDHVRDETCGLKRSIRLARFQVKIAQNRRSDVLIPTVRSLSLMKSPPQLLPQSMSCDERSWTCSMRYISCHDFMKSKSDRSRAPIELTVAWPPSSLPFTGSPSEESICQFDAPRFLLFESRGRFGTCRNPKFEI